MEMSWTMRGSVCLVERLFPSDRNRFKVIRPAGGHLLPALGGVRVAFLLGYSGQVETADGVDGGVDLGGVRHRFGFHPKVL